MRVVVAQEKFLDFQQDFEHKQNYMTCKKLKKSLAEIYDCLCFRFLGQIKFSWLRLKCFVSPFYAICGHFSLQSNTKEVQEVFDIFIFAFVLYSVVRFSVV